MTVPAPGGTARRPTGDGAPSRRRLALALLLIALVATAAALPGAWARSTHGARVSGDEPHYLLTALSLAEDGDLDVADEHTAERWRAFHEVDLSPQARERPDGSMVVPHDPLLPALLAVPARAGGVVGAKVALAVLHGALAALLLWTAVRRFGVRPRTAAVVVGVLAASGPLAVYGTQLYPELPAALALTVAVAALTGPRRTGALVAWVLAVVALPWLAVKYVPVAGAVGLVGLGLLWRDGRRRAVAAASGAFALAAAGYAAGHLVWYRGLTAYASGAFFLEHGGQLSVLGTDPHLFGRSQRLVGLLLDRDFGLIAWQPAWLLGVPAVAALAVDRARPRASVLVPLGVGWVVATWVALTMHGWWFPGRQLVVVLPLLALAMAVWADRSAGRLATAAGLGLLGVATHAWLLAEAVAGRLTLIVDFAATTNPWYRAWRAVRPDHLQPSAGAWALDAAWLALGGLALVLALRRTSSNVLPKMLRRAQARDPGNHDTDTQGIDRTAESEPQETRARWRACR